MKLKTTLMSKCCSPDQNLVPPSVVRKRICPHDGSEGKPVKLITLKSLLKAAALEQLDPLQFYSFCASSDCSVVYFFEASQSFTIADLKVPVFQKDTAEKVPVCYCFGWNRRRIREEIEQERISSVVASITTHVKAKRCGCEVNNPQGSCCLANVRLVVEQAAD